MRHSNTGRKFSRTPSHRKVLLQNLAKALLQHGKIRTTLCKAKDMRRVVEPLITLAKRNDLHARRLAYKVLNDHQLVKYLFDKIGPLYAGIPGGYTRISKLAMPRKGDCAPMAYIELVKKVDVIPTDTVINTKSVPDVVTKKVETESAVTVPVEPVSAPEAETPTEPVQEKPAEAATEPAPAASPTDEPKS